MDKFSIAIPNTKLTAYRVVTAIILFINVTMFFVSVDDHPKWKHQLGIGGIVISLLGIADIYLRRNRNKKYSFALFFDALVWFVLAKYWVGICMLLFAFASIVTFKDLLIRFTEDGIIYPSFPEKNIAWTDVSFAMLKDDILTIDLKNNHLLQFSLMPEAVEGIDVGEFNAYCKEKCFPQSN